MTKERTSWRWPAVAELLPEREGWARLVVSFTGYLMVACLIATIVGKADSAFELGIDNPAAVFAWSILSDIWVFLGLAGLFALAEARHRRVVFVTVPLAIAISIYVALSNAYLIIAGEQGSWQALNQLRKQLRDVEMVLEEAITPGVVVAILGTIVVIVAVPLGLRRLASARLAQLEPRSLGRMRARAALPVALVGGVAVLVLPAPRSVEARFLGDNSVSKLVRTTLRVTSRGNFEGYGEGRLVADAEIERYAARGKRPNVLVLVLESTRYDHTALAGEGAKADTPELGKLARRGTVAHRARAVVPHTTKSMFSMFCSRFPTMQRGVIEVTANDRYQCLPEVLRQAGYRTGFFQSAFGTFEQRARLVDKFGFDEFQAWEDIQGRKLGYLASEDASLHRPFLKFIEQLDPEPGEPRQPFMAVLLTSATHHSYRLSARDRKKARKQERPMSLPEDRYARLVEAEDRLLGKLIKTLRKEKLLDDTIVVVVGDHGEGFGDHGIKQHDNNFYEEGLRVPLVLAGPGVPVGGEIDQNVTLVDLAPTLLGLLGIEPIADQGLRGHDMLGDHHPGDSAPRYFACYSSWRCRGLVLGQTKLVYSPEQDEAWFFDLGADPDERDPQLLTPQLEAMLPSLHALIDAHRTRRYRGEWKPLERYGDWWCPEGMAMCMHPKAYKEVYRYVLSGRGESAVEQGEVPFVPRPDLSSSTEPREGRARTPPG